MNAHQKNIAYFLQPNNHRHRRNNGDKFCNIFEIVTALLYGSKTMHTNPLLYTLSAMHHVPYPLQS